jgi:hypothetical protein
MGYDIERFIKLSINQEFICDICQGILEEPLMIRDCKHLFCCKCIHEYIKEIGVCPKDGFPLSPSQLVEPIKLVKNMLRVCVIVIHFKKVFDILCRKILFRKLASFGLSLKSITSKAL